MSHGKDETTYRLGAPSYLTTGDRWLIAVLWLLCIPISMSILGLAAFALLSVILGGGWLVIRSVGRRPFHRSGRVRYTGLMSPKRRIRGRGATTTPSPHDL